MSVAATSASSAARQGVPGGGAPAPADLAAMLARGQVTTGLIAGVLRAELVGRPDLVITGFDAVEGGKPGTITFIRSPLFAGKWKDSGCSCALVSRGVSVPGHDPSARALIIVENADLAVAKLLSLVMPVHAPPPGRHPSVVIDPTAKVDATASIAANCVIGAGCEVGPGVEMGPGVTLGRGVRVGARTQLLAGVHVGDACVIGAECFIQPGVVIGSEGFGYRLTGGTGELVRMPHLGNVIIEDRVDIGANCSIDRGRFKATRIGSGTKIDNLCQVAHNVQIGKDVIICGCCGIGGSVEIGDGVMIGGCVGVADGTKIGAGARVAAKSGVMQDIPPGGSASSPPALPGREHFKFISLLRRLVKERERSKR